MLSSQSNPKQLHSYQPNLDTNILLSEQLFQVIQQPPVQYPPSSESLHQQNNAHFINECRRFLSQEKHFHSVSKKIEKTLSTIVQSNNELEKVVSKKDSNKSELIYKELDKIYKTKNKLQKRERTLKMICSLISLDKMRKMFRLGQSAEEEGLDARLKKMAAESAAGMPAATQKKIKSQESIDKQSGSASSIKNSIIDQRQYLKSLNEVYQIVLSSQQLNQVVQSKRYPLISDILTELYTLYIQAITKALSAQQLTPLMVKLILTQFYRPFLLQSFSKLMKQSPINLFTKAITANRLQHYRLTLNPVINNLNYANNVIDLYESILETWLKVVEQELDLFSICGQTILVKTATKNVLNQAMPKLEKNIYKLKEISQICFIRYKIWQFLKRLKSLERLQEERTKEEGGKKESGSQEGDSVGRQHQQRQQSLASRQRWEPLPSMIDKMRILLESKIQEESQKLSTSKYNIYSLASYIPIRQYLESMKQCIKYDFEREILKQSAGQDQLQSQENHRDKQAKQGEIGAKEEIQNKNEQKKVLNTQIKKPKSQKQLMMSTTKISLIDWQQPFFKLASSRKPHSQPNNKSLVLFNLNIWYLYLKIISDGNYKTTAVETMLWCKQRLVQMNITQCAKVYYDSLDKILELCGNIPAFSNVLYSQLNLLGHEELRKQIASWIKEEYLKTYKSALAKVGKEQMNNQEVKQFCKDNKINLNKFGKNSNQICIYSVEEISNLISYN